MLGERQPCAIDQSRFLVVQAMGRGVWLINAKGEQEVPSAQGRAQRETRNLMDQLIQGTATHSFATRLRALDYELGSVPVPSQ